MMRRYAGPLAFGIGGVLILITLGVWQVQRLAWKNEIVAAIEARLSGEPGAVPLTPTEQDHEYFRVRAKGALLPGELHVYTSVPPFGVGYLVIAPMQLEDGRRILVDRGFVPIDQKDALRRTGPYTVEGALMWPDETDGFTSPPDQDQNLWFARDVPLMAAALGTEPVLLVAAASDDAEAPLARPVGVNIRNPHLEYAVTWFGLAIVWALMTGYLLWRIKRRTN